MYMAGTARTLKRLTHDILDSLDIGERMQIFISANPDKGGALGYIYIM